MASLINYIIETFKTYSSFGDFYIKVFEIHLSYFDFIMACIWLIILFYFFFAYFINEYSLKIVLVWLLKRVFFAIFFSFLFFVFSNFMYCDTYINRGIQKNFSTRDTIYTIAVTTFILTSFVVAYKYSAWWYTDINRYTRYKDCLEKQNLYNNNYNAYQEYLEKVRELEKVRAQQQENSEFLFKIFLQKYNNFIQKFTGTFLENTNIVNFNVESVSSKMAFGNEVLSNCLRVNNALRSNTFFDTQLKEMRNNYLEISKLTINLKNKNYSCTDNMFKTLEITRASYLQSYNKIINFYKTDFFNYIDFMLNNGHRVAADAQLAADCVRRTQEYMETLDILYNQHLVVSRNLKRLLKDVENLPILELGNIHVSLLDIPRVSKPTQPLENINYPLDSLEGLKFVSINLGYSIFYPILYCSNKIFGTVNPLSSKLFKESISYLISLFKVF